MSALAQLIAHKKIVLCVGSGGVGKTTTAASLAVWAASQGVNVCVMTIDPAKRLANALGLKALGNRASRVANDAFAKSGIAAPPGQLHAMMLDTKRSWDELVERYAPDKKARDRILANNFYQQISGTLTGSQEYMAMEKVYEISESGDYDLLIVDTPPTKHALDFLDAPKKMMDFMDENILRFFMSPTVDGARLGLGMLRRSGAFVFKMLEKVTGMQAIKDLSDFVASFGGMYAGFKDRAGRVYDVMRSRETAFVIVSSANDQSLLEAGYFAERLKDYDMPLGAFVINKLHTDFLQSSAAEKALDRVGADGVAILDVLGVGGEAWARSESAQHVARAMCVNLENWQVLADADHAHVDAFEREHAASMPLVRVPLLEEDVHDLAGLTRLHPYLIGD